MEIHLVYLVLILFIVIILSIYFNSKNSSNYEYFSSGSSQVQIINHNKPTQIIYGRSSLDKTPQPSNLIASSSPTRSEPSPVDVMTSLLQPEQSRMNFLNLNSTSEQNNTLPLQMPPHLPLQTPIESFYSDATDFFAPSESM
jgi:hypothetical protein